MTNIVESILTEKEKTTALEIIDCLRKNNMMTDALGLISRRFSISVRAIADWYYKQRKD